MVSSGERRVTVTYPGSTPVVRTVEVTGGEARTVAVEVSPPPAPVATGAAAAPVADKATQRKAPVARPGMAPVWIGVVSTVALGAAAGVLGSLTLPEHRDLDAAVAQYPLPSDTDDLRSQVRTFGAATDVLLGACVLAAGTTITGKAAPSGASVLSVAF